MSNPSAGHSLLELPQLLAWPAIASRGRLIDPPLRSPAGVVRSAQCAQAILRKFAMEEWIEIKEDILLLLLLLFFVVFGSYTGIFIKVVNNIQS